MKKCLLFGLMLLSLNCFSQNRNSVWCFGDSAGIDFSNIGNPVPYFSAMDGSGSCASISDLSGGLLFYTNTYSPLFSAYVWTALNDTMLNGQLLSDGSYNELQIVPMPGLPNKYYLFHTGARGFVDGLFYSVIDMSLNGGLGEVTIKNQNININRLADCLQAVKHANGRDWWLITKLSSTNQSQNNRFIIYLITPNGISLPINYDFNSATDGDLQKIIFSNKFDRVMLINFSGLMAEYKFDRCSGLISNEHIYFPEQVSFPNPRYFWEGAYSPNDSVFYVTTTWLSASQGDTSKLLQFNLTDTNIALTCDTLAYWQRPILSGAIRLAPDNKIYLTNGYLTSNVYFPYPDSVYNYINMNLSVINDPNNLGAACNFQPFSFYLGGKRTYYGLPNNPNYDLGPLVGSACDTLTSINPSLSIKEAAMYVYYHTSWQTLFVNAQNIKGKNCLLQIFDMNGRCVFTFHDKAVSGYFTQDVPLQTTVNGIYVIKLTTEKETLTTKFVKQ